MAGTVVNTEITHRPMKLAKFAWTSSAGGAADATTSAVFTGKIEGLTTVPDGVAAPTADYDVVVNNADGVDVLMGGGIDRHTSNTEHVLGTSLGCVVESTLTLAVTNAGDTKEGVVYVWVR